MTFKRDQRGITLSGLIMACIVLGVVAVVIMKLWPVYNEKFKVDLAMDRLASTPEANRMGKASIARALQRQFDVDGIEPVTPQSQLPKVLKITKKKGSKNKFVNFAYEIRSPLTAELDVVLNYDKTVELSGEKTD